MAQAKPKVQVTFLLVPLCFKLFEEVAAMPLVGSNEVAAGPLVESNDLYGQMTMAIVGSAVLGFLYSVKQYLAVKKVKMNGHPEILNKGDSLPDALEKMIELGGIIQEGADAFLYAEYRYLF